MEPAPQAPCSLEHTCPAPPPLPPLRASGSCGGFSDPQDTGLLTISLVEMGHSAVILPHASTPVGVRACPGHRAGGHTAYPVAARFACSCVLVAFRPTQWHSGITPAGLGGPQGKLGIEPVSAACQASAPPLYYHPSTHSAAPGPHCIRVSSTKGQAWGPLSATGPAVVPGDLFYARCQRRSGEH